MNVYIIVKLSRVDTGSQELQKISSNLKLLKKNKNKNSLKKGSEVLDFPYRRGGQKDILE
jgi:hypothetical protein